jgi:YidC/Oxa1 family membrane protein insertase
LPAKGYTPLGNTTPRGKGGTFELELRFADFGAGLDRLTLANHLEDALRPEPHIVQAAYPHIMDTSGRIRLTPFSASSVRINGVLVFLELDTTDPGSTYWREQGPGEFEATVVDGDGEPALRITRRFTLDPGSYEFAVQQTLTNLGPRPLSVVLHHIGPIDQPQGMIRYGGDPRNVRFGFMDDVQDDPTRTVQSNDSRAGLVTRSNALGSATPSGAFPPKTLWPNPVSQREEFTLVWAATTSRYFTVAAHNPIVGTPGTVPTDAEKSLAAASVERVAIPTPKPLGSTGDGPFVALGLELVSRPFSLAPGASAELNLAAYAGPTSRRYIDAEVGASRLGLTQVVLFTFGGPCGFCTFQTLTQMLRGFLAFLHDHVLFDWALAIVLLVVCVRSLLHPVTRWSQINMLRFSKGLQKLAPKQKAIQEKYKDEPLKMREESARLMREEGISFGAGAMGCLPALMQTPIWIALSATLYFAFDLRHQPAFFGVFQKLSGGGWSFLADLAEPDRFIRFPRAYDVPLLSWIMGPIDGLNVMPLLLGVVFYIQQKYLQPPPSAALTPEQEQQQKIMKIMTVVLFPLMMYNAPSGLSLYFFINSTLAIFESRHIRQRAERLHLDEPPKKVRAGGVGSPIWDRKGGAGGAGAGTIGGEKRGPGLLERLQKMAEERQKAMDQAKKLQAKKDKGRK